ncbi:MAG: hypothetical protein WDZ93_00300 [Candidatus Paceibacterota bacterium]
MSSVQNFIRVVDNMGKDAVATCTRCGYSKLAHKNGTASFLSPSASDRVMDGKTHSLTTCLNAGGFKG